MYASSNDNNNNNNNNVALSFILFDSHLQLPLLFLSHIGTIIQSK
jgi:hypothetical protein